MFQMLEASKGPVIGLRAQGKLTKEDYDDLLPKLRAAIEKWGKIRMLVELKSIKGIEPAALWEELKFDVKELRQVERCAIVGDAAWEKWLVELSKPFLHAECRYFDRPYKMHAWRWLETGVEEAVSS